VITIEGRFDNVWTGLLKHLLERGKLQSPRGQITFEELGVVLRMSDLRENILINDARRPNYRFMVAEWLWIALGRSDVASLMRYNKQIAQFSDDKLTFSGAYGPRLKPQWDWIIQKLRKDEYSRQSVASIWLPSPSESKDIPCTLNFQFLLRDKHLNCIVTMRSSDVWLGLPYDFFNFSMLTNMLAGELGVECGWLQMNLGSSHLYRDKMDLAIVVWQTSSNCYRSPKLPGRPPKWLEDAFSATDGVVIDKPWDRYYEVLAHSQTSVEALEVLRALSHT
jgi:thymidylate synthase